MAGRRRRGAEQIVRAGRSTRKHGSRLMDVTEEWVERQLRELQVLSAAYPDGFAWDAKLESLLERLDNGEAVVVSTPLTTSVRVRCES